MALETRIEARLARASSGLAAISSTRRVAATPRVEMKPRVGTARPARKNPEDSAPTARSEEASENGCVDGGAPPGSPRKWLRDSAPLRRRSAARSLGKLLWRRSGDRRQKLRKTAMATQGRLSNPSESGCATARLSPRRRHQEPQETASSQGRLRGSLRKRLRESWPRLNAVAANSFGKQLCRRRGDPRIPGEMALPRQVFPLGGAATSLGKRLWRRSGDFAILSRQGCATARLSPRRRLQEPRETASTSGRLGDSWGDGRAKSGRVRGESPQKASGNSYGYAAATNKTLGGVAAPRQTYPRGSGYATNGRARRQSPENGLGKQLWRRRGD